VFLAFKEMTRLQLLGMSPPRGPSWLDDVSVFAEHDENWLELEPLSDVLGEHTLRPSATRHEIVCSGDIVKNTFSHGGEHVIGRGLGTARYTPDGLQHRIDVEHPMTLTGAHPPGGSNYALDQPARSCERSRSRSSVIQRSVRTRSRPDRRRWRAHVLKPAKDSVPSNGCNLTQVVTTGDVGSPCRPLCTDSFVTGLPLKTLLGYGQPRKTDQKEEEKKREKDQDFGLFMELLKTDMRRKSFVTNSELQRDQNAYVRLPDLPRAEKRTQGFLSSRVNVLSSGIGSKLRLSVKGRPTGQLRIALVSDSHGFHQRIDMDTDAVRQADVVLHLGDFQPGTLTEFEAWAHGLTNPIVIYVPGNHDSWSAVKRAAHARDDAELEEALTAVQRAMPYVLYLQDRCVEINGVVIAGWPWHPPSPGQANCTFQVDACERTKLLARLPDTADVIATHGPPHGVLDKVRNKEHCGCCVLRHWIDERAPLLSAFGHVHARQTDDGGRLTRWSRHGSTTFVNAALLSGLTPRSAANQTGGLQNQRGVGEYPIPHGLNQKPIVVDMHVMPEGPRRCDVIWPDSVIG